MMHGLTLLVVEDEVGIREAMQVLLEYHGVRVLAAGDGVQALRILATTKPDAVVCDLAMPKMDGFGFVGRLRSDPRLLHLPVLAVSASVALSDGDLVQRAGFNDQLSKPFDEEQLIAAVRRVAGGRPGMGGYRATVRLAARATRVRALAARERAKALIERAAALRASS
jgi:CheY-like chemotaxis protein